MKFEELLVCAKLGDENARQQTERIRRKLTAYGNHSQQPIS